MDELCGVLNIYKEKGYTSHDVVALVRKYLGRVRTGHTGTLDPAAEGVLPVCVGKATKISDYLTSDMKRYRAVLHLGITTDTGDTSGRVLSRQTPPGGQEEINHAVLSFQGEYMQTPPMYSAIKINGKKLYELAREGIEIERKQRLVSITEIKVLEFLSETQVSLDVVCSKGTYIRSLCTDIGEKLGCGGAMGSLVRTRSGKFSMEQSITLSQLKKITEDGRLGTVLIPIEEALDGFRRVYAYEHAEKYLLNGNKLSLNFLQNRGMDLSMDEMVLVFNAGKKPMGIYRVSEDKEGARILKPVTMLL